MKRLLIILLAIGNGLLAIAQEQDTVVSWQDNDSIVMAPLQVQSVGAANYEELTRIPSSLDLENPDNVTTSIEYDPVMGQNGKQFNQSKRSSNDSR